MAYDEALAQRVRQVLARRSDVEERRMFGGLCFMVAGRMCCGVHKSELILRLPVEQAGAALREPHVKEFDITRRPISGFVMIKPKGCAASEDVARWLAPAVHHALASSATPKPAKRKAPAAPKAARKPAAAKTAAAAATRRRA